MTNTYDETMEREIKRRFNGDHDHLRTQNHEKKNETDKVTIKLC